VFQNYWYQGQIWTNVRILSGAAETGTGTFSCLYLTTRLERQTRKLTVIAVFLKPTKGSSSFLLLREAEENPI
jgi:hypothetical protein